MLPESWRTPRLKLTCFQAEDAKVAKAVFDSNHSLIANDPTFDIFPIEEFE